MPNSRTLTGARASFEPRHGETPAGWHVVRKPGPAQGRQAVREPAHQGLSTLRPDSLPSRPGRTAYPKVSIRRLHARLPPADRLRSAIRIRLKARTRLLLAEAVEAGGGFRRH